MLKKKDGEPTVATTDLPLVDDAEAIVMEPETILDTRWVTKGSRFVEESLVKRKQLPVDEFINMDLEDKVPVKERGIDKPRRSLRVRITNQRFMTRQL